MKNKITKAIFPVAGLGTRFLPATKSIPKEIMTLVDRPLIQYAIDEAREAGIKEFIFVTARGKGALEDYFDSAPVLEANLRKKDKKDALEELRSTNMESGAIAYIRQNKPEGLGHAVWCARRLIADEPFAVILPDDVISSKKSCLKQMVEAHEEHGGNLVAAMEVSKKETANYGIIDPESADGRLVRMKGMEEKPDPEKAPSRYAAIGRYILMPSILGHLSKIKAGSGGEVQLTDAIQTEIQSGGVVHGFQFDGKRYDCGSKIGYLKATIAFALDRQDLGPELKEYISSLK